MSEPSGRDRLVRLHKLLAGAGVASRRRSEELIEQGRVAVNGEVVTRMGVKVDPSTDAVHVDGVRLPPPDTRASVYLAVHKPAGVVSTMHDPQGRLCLADLVEDRPGRLFHVGRLDTDTDGLILLTNDGDLAHRLTHPSYELTKTYVAQVRGVARPGLAHTLEAGVDLEDGAAAVDRFKITDTSPTQSIVELDVHIGRNRVVRRMLAAVGHPVENLTRTGFGPVRLGRLAPGGVRELTRDELGRLLDSVSP